MRHRRRGRTLGRNPSHRRAMLRNLASSLFLTEDDTDDDDNQPKVKGRVVTTLQKAKEVRPLVERCITIARRGLVAMQDAEQYAVDADRHSEPWRAWRQSEQWNQWAQAMAPAVDARRRVLQLLGNNKSAVRVLFDEVAPRYADRPGGYTRIVRLAKPRLGDAGTRAFIEFVGVRDRVSQRSVAPAFDDAAPEESSSQPEAVAAEPEATKDDE